jgi:hypothetical protein
MMAVFRTLWRASVASEIVNCFAAFYRDLRRPLRYGSADGAVFGDANGLAEGCPASPDLLHILPEAFHQLAVAVGLGVAFTANLWVASASFADDVALIAASRAKLGSSSLHT